MGLKDVFKSAFPFISSALNAGGPLGTMAATYVGKALGVEKIDPAAVPDAIAKAVVDPDTMLKLKQCEQEFHEHMAKLGFDHVEKLEQLAAADRASARSREMAVRDKTPMILALFVTIGFFGLLGLLAFHQVPAQSERILDVMVGSLGTAWIGIIGYYFGSSAGSAEKTRLMQAGGVK